MTERGPTPALARTLEFNEARLRVLAENVANVQTPGFRAKQLDVGGFQRALRRAIDERPEDASKPLLIQSGREVRTSRKGRMFVRPSEKPVENVLFHDGTNLSIEREMASLAETGMVHELATSLLRGRFEGLRTAIRGTVR